jgi:hypothetical protein
MRKAMIRVWTDAAEAGLLDRFGRDYIKVHPKFEDIGSRMVQQCTPLKASCAIENPAGESWLC